MSFSQSALLLRSINEKASEFYKKFDELLMQNQASSPITIDKLIVLIDLGHEALMTSSGKLNPTLINIQALVRDMAKRVADALWNNFVILTGIDDGNDNAVEIDAKRAVDNLNSKKCSVVDFKISQKCLVDAIKYYKIAANPDDIQFVETMHEHLELALQRRF